MQKEKKVRNSWLTVRLNNQEYTRLQHFFKQSKCAGLSEYTRSVLLKEPVVIVHRNASADDILSLFLALKKELNALGNNFNQAVKKLHTLDKYSDMKIWIMMNETRQNELLSKVEEIRLRMNQIYMQWSQK